MPTIEEIRNVRIVPVCAVPDVTTGLKMCEALMKAGLPVAEITFRTDAAAEVMQAARDRFPEMLIGAGTVLTKADLQLAIDSGARFAVAPGCNPTVVTAALADGFDFFPGISNPSDIEIALELGVRVLKFFPAEAIGGVKLLKALIGPYGHTGIQFVPTGGINSDNMADYLALPEVAAIGGSWMVKGDLLAAGNFAEIERLAAAAVQAAGTGS